MSSSFIRLVSLALVLSAPAAFAGFEQAPPNFPFRDGEAVFVDFQKATYHIVYDFAAKTATVQSEITFDAPARGYPIFDLIPDPMNVKLDDVETEVGILADPDSASKFRAVRSLVSPGSHRLTMTHAITTNLTFRENGVASAFWMSDLSDRRYLEQYLPTNFEFDQYPMSMRVEVVNAAGKSHVLRANGSVTDVSENVFNVEFPAFYTTSSMYYHLTVKDAIPATNFTIRSVDGRDLPVEIYTNGSMQGYVNEVKRVIAELEADYGAFPHAKLIVYGAGAGGMEYSGATVTSPSAIGHELFHSYNARAVMPAQGNSGWIDEAMSSWRDRNYAKRATAGGTTLMAGHSVWTRMTDDDAYGKGADFLGWIASRVEKDGKDLKDFLRSYFKANFFRTTTTEGLRAAMEAFSGYDLDADFAKYIYGKSRSGSEPRGSTWGSRATLEACGRARIVEKSVVENPYHPRLTKEELLNLL